MDVKKISDKYHSTYILFCFIGVMTQIPHNFYITAHEYWSYKFRNTSRNFDPTDGNKTDLQVQFTSNFSIVSAVCSVVFMVITILCAGKISSHTRMISTFVTLLLLFLITMVFVIVNTDEWQGGFYILTLFLGCILNASGSILQITSVLLAVKFPPQYLAAQLSGQVICGTFAALAQIISIANGADSIKLNALVYFTTAATVIVATLIFYLLQCRNSEFFIHHCNLEVKNNMAKPTKQMFKSVFDETKWYLLTMVLLSSSTSLIHPGLTSLVQSVHTGTAWSDKFFVPVVTFFLYNLLDFLGRVVSTRINKPSTDSQLALFSIFRCALVPLIMFCNAQPRHHTKVAFFSDTAYIVFITLFALTHGYFFNLCVILLPSKMPQENMMASFILIMGVMLCSALAFSFFNVAIIKVI